MLLPIFYFKNVLPKSEYLQGIKKFARTRWSSHLVRFMYHWLPRPVRNHSQCLSILVSGLMWLCILFLISQRDKDSSILIQSQEKSETAVKCVCEMKYPSADYDQLYVTWHSAYPGNLGSNYVYTLNYMHTSARFSRAWTCVIFFNLLITEHFEELKTNLTTCSRRIINFHNKNPAGGRSMIDKKTDQHMCACIRNCATLWHTIDDSVATLLAIE